MSLALAFFIAAFLNAILISAAIVSPKPFKVNLIPFTLLVLAAVICTYKGW